MAKERKWPTENKEEFNKYLNSETMLRRRAFYDIMTALEVYKGERIADIKKTDAYSYKATLQKGNFFKDIDIQDIRPFYHGCARDLLGFRKSFLRDLVYERRSFETVAIQDRDRVMSAAWLVVRELGRKGVRVTKSALTECLLGAREADPGLFAEAEEDGKLPTIERNFFMYGKSMIPVEADPCIFSALEPSHAEKLAVHADNFAKGSRTGTEN